MDKGLVEEIKRTFSVTHRTKLALYEKSKENILIEHNNLDHYIADSFNIERWILQVEVLQRYCTLKNKKVFEVGSGYGGMAFLSKYFEYDYSGIEKDEFSYQISKFVLEDNGLAPDLIIKGDANHINLESNSFDIVTSTNLLEHTFNVSGVLCESLRILKPGGMLIFSFPNFNSFFESHAGILWVPFLSNLNPYLYYRMWGITKKKAIELVQMTNFVTYQGVKKLLSCIQSADESFEVLGWGKDLFIERMYNIDSFRCWDSHKLYRLRALLKILKKMGTIKAVARFCILTNTFTPVVICLRKNIKN